MNLPVIVLLDGTPLYTDDRDDVIHSKLFGYNVQPKIFGYQIVHKISKQLLPTTSLNTIYSKAAAISKMNQVAGYYDRVLFESFDIFNYHLVEVYDHEKPKDYVYIIDDYDFLLD